MRAARVGIAGALAATLGLCGAAGAGDARQEAHQRLNAAWQAVVKARRQVEPALAQVRIEAPKELGDALDRLGAGVEASAGALKDDASRESLEGARRLTTRLNHVRLALQNLHRRADELASLPRRFAPARSSACFERYASVLESQIRRDTQQAIGLAEGTMASPRYDRAADTLGRWLRTTLEAESLRQSVPEQFPQLKDSPLAREATDALARFVQVVGTACGSLADRRDEGGEVPEVLRNNPYRDEEVRHWRRLLQLAAERAASEDRGRDAADNDILRAYLEACEQEEAAVRELIAICRSDAPREDLQQRHRETQQKMNRLAAEHNEARQLLHRAQVVMEMAKRFDELVEKHPGLEPTDLRRRFADAREELTRAQRTAAKARAESRRVDAVLAQGEAEIAQVRMECVLREAQCEAEIAGHRERWGRHLERPELQPRVKEYATKAAALREGLRKLAASAALQRQIENRIEQLQLKSELLEDRLDRDEEHVDRLERDLEQLAEMIEEVVDELREGGDGLDRDAEDATRIPLDAPVDNVDIF